MTDAEKNILKQWIEKAEHDLVAAQILIDANPIILDIACFHCQQSIEKYLKSFLIYHNQEFQYSHNLDYLVNECAEINSSFKSLDIKDLNVYAVRARYPHDYVAPELSEVKEYCQIALRVRSMVLENVGDIYSDQGLMFQILTIYRFLLRKISYKLHQIEWSQLSLE